MHGWEYVRVEWGPSYLTLWPSEKFDANWIKQTVASALKEVKVVPTNAPAGTLPYYFVGIHKANGDDVGAVLIQRLGSEGWEAVSISEGPRSYHSGNAWLKRPITK